MKLNHILIADYGAYPFIIQLCKQLSLNGYMVSLAYASYFGGPTSISDKNNNGVDTYRIELPKFPKNNFLKRVKHEYKFGKALVNLISNNQFDHIIFANIPLISMRITASFCKKNNQQFILWLHDLLSVAAKEILSSKFGIGGRLLGRLFTHIEINILKQAAEIICIAEEFKPYLKNWRIDQKKLRVIPNWAPVDEIPVVQKINDFSTRHNIESKFVILYSGTMGMKQNPQIIYEAASLLRKHEDIIFLIVSEGIGADYLKDKKTETSLKNIELLPYQPYDRLPEVLGSANVLIAILNKDAGEYCVPSKVWTNYCAQRASILIMPEKNQAAYTTDRIKAGIIISDYSSKKFADSILYLYQNKNIQKMMGKNARLYAQKSFSIEKKAKEFENLFEKST